MYSYKKKVKFVLLGLLCLLALYYYETRTQGWQEAVQYANTHLSHKGTLMAKRDGFIYLKVDESYIYTLFPLLHLKEKGFKIPPYFRGPNSPGAHISVIYSDEHVIPKELGSVFHFEPVKIELVHTSNATYAILQVHSPELEALRRKYGLSPKLHGHEFHISLAKKFAN